MRMLPGPPMLSSHFEVEAGSEWDITMQEMLGLEEVMERREMNVFSAKGQPQWRRKVTRVGLPLVGGRDRCGVEGALEPMVGTGEVEREGEVGKAQDESS